MRLNKLGYTPKVSIVIPAYNASNYLAEAIDSALAQTYPNVEIIVVNDGSEDEGATRKIAMSFGNRIRYFEKKNGGSSSALNMGIVNMSGEWFSWLSHDDLYYPQKLEKQIEYLNCLECTNNEISKNILFSASELIDKNKKIIMKPNSKKIRKISDNVSQVKNNGGLICEPTKYMFHGCSGLIHKDVFKNVGIFNERLKLLNDVDMWYRIYAAGYKVHYLPMILVQGRVHDKQVSKKIGFSYHNSEQDMYWQRSLRWLKENCSNEHRLFIRYGCNAYLKTRKREGKEAFVYAKTVNPRCALELFARQIYCICYAKMRTIAKNIYINLRMDN